VQVQEPELHGELEGVAGDELTGEGLERRNEKPNARAAIGLGTWERIIRSGHKPRRPLTTKLYIILSSLRGFRLTNRPLTNTYSQRDEGLTARADSGGAGK
jgi:hypothetical protein